MYVRCTMIRDLVTPSDLAGCGFCAAVQSQLFLARLAAHQSTFIAAPPHPSLLGGERQRERDIFSWTQF